ncbi:unnamed protein product, partial [Coffea canephora]
YKISRQKTKAVGRSQRQHRTSDRKSLSAIECKHRKYRTILNGQPKVMGLKELLLAFLDFRCSVIERRARFKLSHTQDRHHTVEGIVVGFVNLDRVIDIIRQASSDSGATAQLMKGNLR